MILGGFLYTFDYVFSRHIYIKTRYIYIKKEAVLHFISIGTTKFF